MPINTKPTLEDRLVGPDYPYESKEEASIAKMLESYGIPFLYKQPTLVIENGKRMIEYADFFLPTYNGLAIDYIIESNSAIYRRKKNVYQDNQTPAVLMTRKDLQKPNWHKELYRKLVRDMQSKASHEFRTGPGNNLKTTLCEILAVLGELNSHTVVNERPYFRGQRRVANE